MNPNISLKLDTYEKTKNIVLQDMDRFAWTLEILIEIRFSQRRVSEAEEHLVTEISRNLKQLQEILTSEQESI